jgi:hypothetical protein
LFRSEFGRDEDRHPGSDARESHSEGDAPPMLRTAAALSFVALIARLIASALPGSRSGIEVWIRRADATSGLFAQLTVLVGSSLLVMLVVSTLARRDLGAAYRILVVPAAAGVLMLVMLASSMGLEPIGSLALGVSCLALSGAGASTALRSPSSRAPGLVLSLLTLGSACRLLARLFAMSLIARASAGGGSGAWLATAGSAFDVLAVALAAARLLTEHRTRASAALVGIFAAAGALSWGALRGSLDRASPWQIIAARALAELSSGSGPAASIGGRVAVDTIAVLLAGVVVSWPGRVSSGTVAIALGLLARSGLDVPVSALMLALGALVAALGSVSPGEPFSPLSARPAAAAPRAGAAAGADG